MAFEAEVPSPDPIPMSHVKTISAPAAARLFERAVKAHLAQELEEAAALYRSLLEKEPNHAEAANNLSAIVARAGDRRTALELLHHAVTARPGYGEALNNLGLLYSESGDFASAHGWFLRAVAAAPDNADWLNNLGGACVELRRDRDAFAAYDRAVSLRPNCADFWSNRGVALRALRRPVDAAASLEHAIEIDPDHVNALSNLGTLYKERRDFDRAVASLERAIAIQPGNAALICNLASVFEPMGRYDRAREYALRALRMDPSSAEAYNVLANAEMEEGHYDDALALYEKARALEPENRNANWNIALIWLLRGDFERGWKQFEWRKRLQSSVVEVTVDEGEAWDGTPLAGRTILLRTEQGAGDAVQFIRYAEELKRRGASRVFVETPASIAPLLGCCGAVDSVFTRGEPLPPYDVHAELMSLPWLCGTRLDTIPARVPYLRTEPREVAKLVKAPDGMLKVGIVWSGNPQHRRDRLRSVAAARFAPLVALPTARFFSLQVGDDSPGPTAALGGSIIDLAPHLRDYVDTAAALEHLDLVITVDTSVAHLAGALGCPVWVLLPHVPDFRWMTERDDSPWYPSMRLFRQPAPGDWNAVFAEVERALRERLGIPAPNADVVGAETSLDAATRNGDGSPRFRMEIPIDTLGDASRFAEYEAELVGEGFERGAREFLDEFLGATDVFLDVEPGLGLTALSAATAPHRPVVVAVETTGTLRDALESHAVRLEAVGRLRVHGALPAAARDAAAIGGRIVVRAPDVAATVRCLEAMAKDAAAHRVAAVLVGNVAPDEWRGLLQALAPAEFLPIRAEWNGRLALEPVQDWSLAQPMLFVEAVVLDALVEAARAAPDERTGAAPRATVSRIGVDWELRTDTGWGVYGTHLVSELARLRDVHPVVFDADLRDLSPLARLPLSGVLDEGAALARALQSATGGAMDFDGLMLRALGNNFGHGALWSRIRARRNVGVIFFEDPAFDDAALERARSLDLIVAGSTWNAEVLRSSGLERVRVALQGIDPTVFHPAPHSGRFGDRFVIFSGGKLEFRKGQDIVIAAFRRFRQRHPEALLVTAWHNSWPQLIADLALAGHVRGQPAASNGALDIGGWLASNGVPAAAAVDIGRLPNALMGQIVREADVALFPNRCEGGTNLVAMECMAAGVPTIVSANTGHLDLVGTRGCLPLERQGGVPLPTRFFRSTAGWGESDVDEVVEALERVWGDAQAAQEIARCGAAALAGWTWSIQVTRLLDTLRHVL